jgi:hypothetical protein
MNRETEHTCRAYKCTVRVDPALFMCSKHWRMVPHRLQRAVWRAYVPGQENRRNPSGEYMLATREAIDYVAKLEDLPPPPMIQPSLFDEQ